MTTLNFLTILLILIFNICKLNSIRVCDNFESYLHPNDGHCFDNPDGESNVTQMIQRLGFTVEENYIYTKDGYRLLIVRTYYKITQDTPIVLGHAAAKNSESFVNRGNKSIVYYLGMKGYEIYLINFRGTIYSKSHRTLSTDDEKFWDFSFYEWGNYDISATLLLVQSKSEKKALYIGYSTATAASYIYATRKATETKENLKGIISLAPIAYLHNIKSAYKILIRISTIFRPLILLLTHGEIKKIPYLKQLCSYYPWQMYLCQAIKGHFLGFDFGQMDPLYMPLIGSNMDSYSLGMLNLYDEIIESGRFAAEDFGIAKNYLLYAQATPLPYNLTTIPVPVALFVGKNDWISTYYNYARLYSELSTKNKCGLYTIKYDKWNHGDFIEARDIANLLYKPLYTKIKEITDGKCKS